MCKTAHQNEKYKRNRGEKKTSSGDSIKINWNGNVQDSEIAEGVQVQSYCYNLKISFVWFLSMNAITNPFYFG